MIKFFTLLLATSLTFWLTPCQSQTLHEVQATNFQFTPAALTINVGDTVRWTNTQGNHNVNGSLTTFPNNPEAFFSGAPANATWTYEYVFTTAGHYDYRCDNHFSIGMVGTIDVSAPSGLQKLTGNQDIIDLLYPNPASNSLQIQVNFAHPARLQLEIINIVGQLVDRVAVPNNGIMTLDIRNYQAGMYFIRCWNSNQLMGVRRFAVK